jgi:arginyl-tRNA synthetase
MTVISEGAKCVPLDGYNLVVEKSDGSHLYTTTDLAALKYRVDNGYNWIIYVTDDSQKLHFQQIMKVIFYK